MGAPPFTPCIYCHYRAGGKGPEVAPAFDQRAVPTPRSLSRTGSGPGAASLERVSHSRFLPPLPGAWPGSQRHLSFQEQRGLVEVLELPLAPQMKKP